jgi:hypothetical protein
MVEKAHQNPADDNDDGGGGDDHAGCGSNRGGLAQKARRSPLDQIRARYARLVSQGSLLRARSGGHRYGRTQVPPTP